MRPKNFNFVERYVEKVILAVAALFFLLVGWFYFLGDPYLVKLRIGQDLELRPNEIEQKLLTKTEDLRRLIKSEETPEQLRKLSIPDYINDFRKRATRPSLTVGQFEVPLSEVGLDERVVQSTIVEAPLFAVPLPPPPTNLLVSKGHAVLAEPQDPQLLSGLVHRIGDHTPRDFRWVTVAGQFDTRVWRDRLRQGDPENPQARPMPQEWWRNKMLMVHAVMERQKRDPRTGEWGPIEEIEALPNALVNMPPQQRRFVQSEHRELLDRLYREQREIARPRFVELASGTWLRPGAVDRQLTGEQAARLSALRKEAQDVQAAIARLDSQLQRLGTSAGAERDRKRINDDRVRQQQRLDGVRRQIGEITGEEAPAAAPESTVAEPDPGAMGLPPQAAPPGMRTPPIAAAPRRPAEAAPPTPPAPEDAANSNDEGITFWRHDIGVEPGAVYRYRLRVNMLNPLFQRAQLKREQEREHFHKKELESEYSPWTEPVLIEPEYYYYVVQASRQQAAAEVEVYRVFGGNWHRQMFTVRPGDPIGSDVTLRLGNQEYTIKMRLGVLVVDLEYEVSLPGANLGAKTARIVLYDERQGQLLERTVDVDRQDPNRLRLQALSQGPVANLP